MSNTPATVQTPPTFNAEVARYLELSGMLPLKARRAVRLYASLIATEVEDGSSPFMTACVLHNELYPHSTPAPGAPTCIADCGGLDNWRVA